MYNVCSVYRKEVQWLLRLELSGEVLFSEIEVVPQHNNQERNSYKKNSFENTFLDVFQKQEGNEDEIRLLTETEKLPLLRRRGISAGRKKLVLKNTCTH